ncbi:extracellular catalytic domain type 2 short-chain-length polyhydroxyalkanoate depolymerase [Bradyrhizobium ottawaense]|uniref:Poly(3-hydroxybutyrate) depolymerase n=1 Tax=Bradyrhizobium ottawaense TaxID=931866 RepID=A0ABV4FIJ3_9BRAD
MHVTMLRQHVVGLICAMAVGISPLAAQPSALRSYNAPIGESSVSGISSGAFMAIQFGTAWSSIIKGVGVVAGGPYWCAEANYWSDFITGYWGPIWRATGQCMKGPASDLNIKHFTNQADAKASAGEIDPLSNLARQKIYLFHGYNDAVVYKAAPDAAAEFYRHYLGDGKRGNLFYQTVLGAGHSFVVTKQNEAGLNDCSANKDPYIDQCGYDQAGIILQHIYGRLNPLNRGQLAGTLKSFDQSLYTRPHTPDELSLGDKGYAFVPQDCEQGAPCRVHVALHGCKQDVDQIGPKFVDYAGYNAWADTNSFIILYPQTKPHSYWPTNPDACWDWWSYVNHTDDYVTKSGPQIKAIKAMLDALTGGTATPTATLDSENDQSVSAPQGLTANDASDSSVDLVWFPVSGATTYKVQRAGADRAFQTVGEVAGASFGDSGLTPQTAFRWRVSAMLNGTEGPASEEVIATTRSRPLPCNDPGSCPVGPIGR